MIELFVDKMAIFSDSCLRFGMCCCIILLVVAPYVLPQTAVATANVLPEFTAEPREGDAVSLRCEILQFQSGIHLVSWRNQTHTLTFNGMVLDQITDPRYSTSVISTSSSDSVPEVHILTIFPASQAFSGTYTCTVYDQTFAVISSAQAAMTVYPAEIFPSCSPPGPASLLAGTSISCTVESDAMAAVVTVSADGSYDVLDWPSSVPINGTGTQLTISVTSAEDGFTFNCSSVSVDFSGVTLSCQIGPLSVSSPSTVATTPSTVDTTQDLAATVATTTSPQASSSSTGTIVAVVIVILILILIGVIAALILCRRKLGMTPFKMRRSFGRSIPSSQPPPSGQHLVENDIAPPQKPVPYALSVRQRNDQVAPAEYAAVVQPRRESGEASPEKPTGVVYASVHKESKKKETGTKPPKKPIPYAMSTRQLSKEPVAPVVYASVDPHRKTEQLVQPHEPQQTPEVIYTSVKKDHSKDFIPHKEVSKESSTGSSEPSPSADVTDKDGGVPDAEHGSPTIGDEEHNVGKVEVEEIVYVDLDLINNSSKHNEMQLSKEEPTVYASLADMK